MSFIKDVWAEFKKLTKSKKMQFMAALILTIALLCVIPVYAWFNYQRKIVKLQKIDSPNSLYLNAAHREDTINFWVDGINAEEIYVDDDGSKILDGNNREQKITYKDYVFNVTGEAVDKFTIQLAYTTNNPFTYEVYAADEFDETDKAANTPGQDNYVVYEVTDSTVDSLPEFDDDSYHPDAASPDKLYYRINASISDTAPTTSGKYTGEFLNSINGGLDANNNYLDKSYGSYTTHIQTDAKPVYWQATNVSAFPGVTNSNKKPFSRHFILRVRWPAGELDNTDKETDIIYITVKATS